MNLKKRIIHRRGSILVYSIYMMFLMLAIISLAVDYGHTQVVKTEEQRCADATARGTLEACLSRYLALGYSTPTSMAQSYATAIGALIAAKNPVDANSGYNPTVTVTVGSWNTGTGTFTADNGAAGPLAIKVIVSRSAANNNSVPLAFPLPSGKGVVSKTCDVWAKSIAMLPNKITLSQTVQATYDPWLSGMPSGSTASYDDTAPGESPVPITVIPGSTLTVVTAVTGTVRHAPTTPWDPAGGDTSQIYWHMKDPPTGSVASGQGTQNNIGDILTPIDSLLGVFLDNNQPSAANQPSVVRDYTSQSARDDPDFNDIQLQQPFYIGTGINSSNTTATFVVPDKATRFYMGPMDGYEWNNNGGSFSVSFNEQPPIQIVQ